MPKTEVFWKILPFMIFYYFVGDFGLSIVYFGYAGDPLEEKIRVNKKTGTILMRGHPTIINPLKE